MVFQYMCNGTNLESLTLSEGQSSDSKAKTRELPIRKRASFNI